MMQTQTASFTAELWMSIILMRPTSCWRHNRGVKWSTQLWWQLEGRGGARSFPNRVNLNRAAYMGEDFTPMSASSILMRNLIGNLNFVLEIDVSSINFWWNIDFHNIYCIEKKKNKKMISSSMIFSLGNDVPGAIFFKWGRFFWCGENRLMWYDS